MIDLEYSQRVHGEEIGLRESHFLRKIENSVRAHAWPPRQHQAGDMVLHHVPIQVPAEEPFGEIGIDKTAQIHDPAFAEVTHGTDIRRSADLIGRHRGS